jgi:outer membrane protein TolC
MRLTQRLQEVGRITAVDALRFAQDLSEAKSELLSAIEALSEAREAVGSALGVSAAVGFGEAFEPLGLLTQAGSGCRPIAGLAARPDRQAAAQRLAQAETAASGSRLAYLPELRLQSLYSARLSTSFETPFPPSRELVHDWGARANLVWTAYDGGQRASEVQRADAEVLRLRAAADQLILDTDLEQRRSRRLVSVTRENLAAAQASVEAARKLDELSRKALELGTASSLEVVDAARRLRAVEITLAVREVEALSAQLRARLALAVCE